MVDVCLRGMELIFLSPTGCVTMTQLGDGGDDGGSLPSTWVRFTVTCLSAHHFQHRGQTAQQKDWTLSNSSERHARAHCDHTPPTQHRGRMHSPPPTHRHRNTHIWSKLTCHSTFNNHRLHVGRLRNHQPGLFLLLLLLFFFFFLKQSVLQPCEVTERHLQ